MSKKLTGFNTLLTAVMLLSSLTGLQGQTASTLVGLTLSSIKAANEDHLVRNYLEESLESTRIALGQADQLAINLQAQKRELLKINNDQANLILAQKINLENYSLEINELERQNKKARRDTLLSLVLGSVGVAVMTTLYLTK